jgi:preprotein translocase subunit SecA
MNSQRKVIYAERHRVMEGADLHEQVREFVGEVVEEYVRAATTEGFAEEWDLDKLWKAFQQLYPISLTVDELIESEAGGEREALTAQMIIDRVKADALEAYDRREEQLGAETMRDVERRVILSVIDRKWREHLYEMDYLQEGISLRAYAQRDPLIEYQREGFDMFTAMLEGVKEESVGYLFNLEIQVQDNPIVQDDTPQDAGVSETEAIISKALRRPQRPTEMIYTAPGESGEVEQTKVRSTPAQRAAYGNVERNAPCPCGSGKKYKRCHGDPKNTNV